MQFLLFYVFIYSSAHASPLNGDEGQRGGKLTCERALWCEMRARAPGRQTDRFTTLQAIGKMSSLRISKTSFWQVNSFQSQFSVTENISGCLKNDILKVWVTSLFVCWCATLPKPNDKMLPPASVSGVLICSCPCLLSKPCKALQLLPKTQPWHS